MPGFMQPENPPFSSDKFLAVACDQSLLNAEAARTLHTLQSHAHWDLLKPDRRPWARTVDYDLGFRAGSVTIDDCRHDNWDTYVQRPGITIGRPD
jgi:hypothetical protein